MHADLQHRLDRNLPRRRSLSQFSFFQGFYLNLHEILNLKGEKERRGTRQREEEVGRGEGRINVMK